MSLRSKILPVSPSDYSVRCRWLGHSTYWLCQFGGWFGLAAILFASSYTSASKAAVADQLVLNLTFALCAIFCTHLLRVVVIRERSRGPSWLTFLVRIIPWVIGTSAALLGGMQLNALIFDPETFANPDNAGSPLNYFITVLYVSIALLMWLSLYMIYHYYVAYQNSAMEQMRLKAELKDTELSVLKGQLNPHFLFNSLNILRALIPEEQGKAREAVTLLADLLRGALTIDPASTVTLEQELKTVEDYLALEKLRFEERLQVEMDVPSEALSWRIPPYLLQTLFENAMKYGISPRPEGGLITLTARPEKDILRLVICNPGSLSSKRTSTAVGLGNARARLSRLLGNRASLTLCERPGDIVAAELLLPLQPSPSSPPFQCKL